MKIVKCWNCDTPIDLDECDDCRHSEPTKVCPYCKECLCHHPNFKKLKRIEDADGWHVGKVYRIIPYKC